MGSPLLALLIVYVIGILAVSKAVDVTTVKLTLKIKLFYIFLWPYAVLGALALMLMEPE